MITGRMNQYVTFQRKVTGRKANGQPKTDWEKAFETWASVIAVRAREKMQQGRDVSVTMYTLIIRYDPSNVVTNGMRVLTDNGALEVQSSDLLHGKKEYSEVICQTHL